jgi:hypothetical protein
MGKIATSTGKRVVFMSTWFLGIIAVLLSTTTAWATTTFKDNDIEVQAWYRMRHTFQTDGKEHFEWVQWRNEAFVWTIWRNFVRSGKLLDTVPIPFVKSAEVNARYQARVDPVYYLRQHYRNLYTENERANFLKPQDLFRDLFLDLDHGDLGPGDLTSRWGYQTIVWGEMDLYRSLDIINPLRLDQSAGVGEKLDELRLPILAAKFLYNLGSVGESFSQVGLEGWFTPNVVNRSRCEGSAKLRVWCSHTPLPSQLPYRSQQQERGSSGCRSGPGSAFALRDSCRKDRPMQLRLDPPLQRFERQRPARMVEQQDAIDDQRHRHLHGNPCWTDTDQRV